jgi:hypothetical protein
MCWHIIFMMQQIFLLDLFRGWSSTNKDKQLIMASRISNFYLYTLVWRDISAILGMQKAGLSSMMAGNNFDAEF